MTRRRWSWGRSGVRVAAGGCAAALAVWTVPAAAVEAAPVSGPVVVTNNGPVRGSTQLDLSVFRGIPYAAAPTGDRRFKPPVEPRKWTEPRDASVPGPACVQDYDEHELAEGEPMSEDCLTVNVWTTATGGKPVIVFVHGGGFTSGSDRDPWYDGAALARRGVVVVTLQYRVGPFGWLDLSALGGDYSLSMNNGLLDQMAALRWVRANATAFGGDARNVTLVGESAGAISISALLGTPSADGLFDRAVLQSGTAGTIATRQWSGQVSRLFADKAGVQDPQDVRGLGADQIQQAARRVYDTEFSDTAFHPVVDGSLIPDLPMKRLAAKDGPTTPVIIGSNLDEARYWLYYIPEIDRLPLRYGRPWLTALVGDRADRVIDAYRRERPQLDDAQTGMALAGDVGFRMPAIRMAEALSRRGVPAYMYLATVTSPDLDGRMGSPHAIELPFVFGTLDADRAPAFVGTDPANKTLSDTVQQLWTSFAATGTPRAAGLTWPSYDTTRRATLMLDRHLTVQDDPYPQARKAWGDLSFDGSDPGLDRLTPLQYNGTDPYDPLVIAAVIGWPGVVTGAVVLIGLITVTVVLSRRLRRRRG